MPLKTRKTLPAGGLFFYEARTGWSPMAMLDFDTTVKLIIEHRMANPRFKGQWSLDFETVANELDLQTCQHLASKGLSEQFCIGENGVSFQTAPAPVPQGLGQKLRESVAVAKKYVTGVKVITDWLGDGADPVTSMEATRRSSICSACPKNKPGSYGDFFAEEAADLIRKQIAIKHDMNLKTSNDESLGVCSACLCPLKLKVWAPLFHIKKHLKQDAKADLDKACWILE